jgi:serine/threonine protein phosphatase PrpC
MVKAAYRSFAYTTKGRTHQKEDVPCQDYSAQYGSGGLLIAAVADGHGEANSFRSDRGSKFAVDCAMDAIREFGEKSPEPPRSSDVLDDVEILEDMVGGLVRRVVFLWQDRVERDYKEDPFTADELSRCDARHRARLEREEPFKAYGSTLIAAAVTEKYWFGFHIGDGRFTVLKADGTFAQPVPWDERCYLHLTTSICDYDANDRPRVHCEIISEKSPPPIALFLCSDGIDDNYPVEDNEKHLYELYAQIADAFAADGFESTSEQIEALCDSFAKNGKGDDTSLAIIIDMERVQDRTQTPESRMEAQENGEEPEEAAPVPPDPAAQNGEADTEEAHFISAKIRQFFARRRAARSAVDPRIPAVFMPAWDRVWQLRTWRGALFLALTFLAVVLAAAKLFALHNASPAATAKTQNDDRNAGAGLDGNANEAAIGEAKKNERTKKSPEPKAPGPAWKPEQRLTIGV